MKQILCAKRTLAVLCLLTAAFLFLPQPHMFGQLSSSSTITGTVTDSSGAVVPGAAVTILNEESQVKTSTKTDSAGAFTVPALPPGRYSVTVEQQGFKTYTETGLALHPTLVATVSPVMQVGNVTTGVTVLASAVQVQTATPEVSSQVSAQQVSMLPLNGSNFQSLSALNCRPPSGDCVGITLQLRAGIPEPLVKPRKY